MKLDEFPIIGGIDGKEQTTLHKAATRKIWIDQLGFSRREKLYRHDVNVS